MEEQEEYNINRVVLAIDTSNFLYCVTWAAVTEWKENYKEDSSHWLKTPDATDQDNLPNILNCNSFVKTLKRVTQDKTQRTIWLAQNRNIEEFSEAEGIDIFFVEDSRLTNNFRKKIYPQYKAQRKLVKKIFDIEKVKDYIRNVILVELDVEKQLGCRFIKFDGCESDDIIAIIMKVCHDYKYKIIMSSDRDFLQLSNVKQYDMFGKRIERKIKKVEEELSPHDFLIWKILRGDVSDNIKNVFAGYGEIKSYKLVKDIPTMKRMLNENQDAAKRFMLNRKLIDFRSIPEDIIESVSKLINEKLDELHVKDKIEEFSLQSCMNL